jgi:hypothetical protein
MSKQCLNQTAVTGLVGTSITWQRSMKIRLLKLEGATIPSLQLTLRHFHRSIL